MEWKKLSEERVWDGYRKIDRWTFELPTGVIHTYEIRRDGTPVCVLPLTGERTVILAKQFRPGPMKVLLELPGGGTEPGEDPADAIRRELLEETGYTGDFQFIGTSLAESCSTLVRYNFVATNCRPIQEPANDPREPIEIMEMTLESFRNHLRSGQLSDVGTGYMGLDFLGLL